MDNNDYFELFGLPPSFAITQDVLEARYLALQSVCHPDRLTDKSPAERQIALRKIMAVNDGYRTLKNPLSRAEHLLRVRGWEVNTERSDIKPSHELLMEIMEWRESILDGEKKKELDGMRALLCKEIDGAVQAIAECWERDALEAMAQHTMRLKYIMKTLEEIKLQKNERREAMC